MICRGAVNVGLPFTTSLSHVSFGFPPHQQGFAATPSYNKEPVPPVAIWKGHSFNTISGREAEKFSGKDSGKGDSDFNDSDSDISGDALKKDLITHMQNGKGSAPALHWTSDRKMGGWGSGGRDPSVGIVIRQGSWERKPDTSWHKLPISL